MGSDWLKAASAHGPMKWVAAGFSALFSEAPAHAGFLQPDGVTQVISSISASRFSRQFDGAGRLRRASQFSKLSLETHIERGFGDRFMSITRLGTEQLTPAVIDANTSLWQARFIETGARMAAGDIAGVRLSGQALIGWRSCTCFGQALTADVRGVAALPFQFQTFDGFAEVQAGYRHGGRVERSEWRLDATIGLRPHPNVLLLAQGFAAVSGRDGLLPPASRLKGEFGIVWDVNRVWSIQASAFTTLAGRNAGQETGGRIAIWRRFTPPPAAQGF